MKVEVSLVEKDHLTGGNDEYINALDVKRTSQQTEGVKDTISCLNLNTYNQIQIEQGKPVETDSDGLSFEKSQHSSSIRVLSELDDRTEKSYESIIEAGNERNKALPRNESLGCIEWSGEERVFSPETKFPLSKTEFYSNWKHIINHQEAPRTPQFRAAYVYPTSPCCSDSDESYSDSSSNSFESLLDLQKEVPTLKTSDQVYKHNSRRVSGISWSQYEGANEVSYNYISPSLPIPSNHIQGRNRLGILLSQWVNHFSGRQPVDINDMEYATQFFTGMDRTTLAAVANSLIYIGQCARCTQIRKFGQG